MYLIPEKVNCLSFLYDYITLCGCRVIILDEITQKQTDKVNKHNLLCSRGLWLFNLDFGEVAEWLKATVC